MFNITDRKGFQLTFENGWTISCQWGPFNYCTNRGNFDLNKALNAAIMDPAYKGDIRCDTCECYIFNQKIDFEHQANITADIIARIMPLVASFNDANFADVKRQMFQILDQRK